MRKFIVIFLTVSFLFVGISKKVTIKAKESYVKNILDLSNLYISEQVSESSFHLAIKTINPIKLDEGELYTIVLSKEMFFDVSYDQEGFESQDSVFFFYDENKQQEMYRHFNYIKVGEEYCYFTFEASYTYLEILELPVDGTNFGQYSTKIMLYKGDINDFNGEFTSYKSDFLSFRGVYVRNYDSDETLNEILDLIKVTDDFSNNLNLTIIKDDYTPNIKTVGEHEVVLTLTDDYQNRVFYDLLISIVDVTSPVVSGVEYYKVEANKESVLLETIIDNLNYSDNVSFLYRENVIVASNDYDDNKNKIGSHNIVFHVIDEAGNYTSFEVVVEVVDTTPPVIKGPAEIFRYTTDDIIDIEYIKKMFKATDLTDGDITHKLTIEGEYENIPGRHQITIKVEDSSGNIATKRLGVIVVDAKTPTFLPDDLILTTNQYNKMDHEDLKKWLQEQLSTEINFKILLDETLYNDNTKENKYIYYSYEQNKTTHYGRVIVTPPNNKVVKIMFITTLGLVNILFLINYFKRPKIHL